MMSAEGVGLTLGFGSLFVTLIGISVASGKGYGTLQEQSRNTNDKLDKLIETNREGHEKIFDCLKEINGTVREHGARIANLEEDVKGKIQNPFHQKEEK